MGTGIAKVAAQVAKVEVVLMDKDATRLTKSMDFIGKCTEPATHQLVPLDQLLQKDVAKNKSTKEESTEVRKRISTATSLKGLANVDFVIEV
jgi:3-hydroxyacyl-CoA dehydrogenase